MPTKLLLTLLVLFGLAYNGTAAERRARAIAPAPPTPPPGLAEIYYATCGGSHNPIPYVVPKIGEDDPRYPELVKYFHSSEYQKWALDIQNRYAVPVDPTPFLVPMPQTPTDYSKEKPPPPAPPLIQPEPSPASPETVPEVEPVDPPDRTGETTQMDPVRSSQPTQEIPRFIQPLPERFLGFTPGSNPSPWGEKIERGGMYGKLSGRMNRDPGQDLARWFRGWLYHQPVPSAVEGTSPPAEPAVQPGR